MTIFGLMAWIGITCLIVSFWVEQYSRALWSTGWTLIIVAFVFIVIISVNEVNKKKK